jgi:O-acetyl-ADP-ribose deacetylase (regulator of RNase III)
VTNVDLVNGDIAHVPADALITAINSGGAWFGGIDGVIQRVAGNLFHSQAKAAMPLTDGQIIVAMGNGQKNNGAFRNVVFVVDDLKRPLHQIIFNGLVAASEAGFRSVTLPAVRLGVMRGVVEKSNREALAEIAKGIQLFLDEHPGTPLEQITFVVYSDSEIYNLLSGLPKLLV